MLTFAVIMGAAFVLYRLLGGAAVLRIDNRQAGASGNAKLVELSEYAQRLRKANKYLAAEKVYLQILKIDHKNAATYSQLGSLYLAIKNLDDALECLRIASQLSPSASTHYSLGLGYYENRNFMKAIASFEKATMFEPSAKPFIGLSRAYQKLGNQPRAIKALERAVEVQATPRTLGLLAEALVRTGRAAEATELYEKIRKLDPHATELRQGAKLPPGSVKSRAS